MRSKLNFIMLALTALAFAGCKHSDYFILSGEVQNPKSIQKVYLYMSDTSGTSTRERVIDSAALSDQGKFSFKQSTSYPNMYKLKIGGAMFDLIAQNGDDIGFKTNAVDTTNAYEIAGSVDSEHIKDFNKLANFYGRITAQIVGDYNAKLKALGGQSDSLFKLTTVLYKKNEKDYSNAAAKFMKDNENSLTGFYAASSLNPVLYEAELIAYSDDIKDKFKGNPVIDQFVKHMEDIKPVSIGHAPPEFRLMDLNYQPVTVTGYKGKYLMIDFWASWCAPCRQENPNVVKLYNKFKDKGLNILGVSLDNNRMDWEAAVKADGLTWTHVSEFKGFQGPVVEKYKVEAIPANYIIGPDGKIIAKNLMGAELEEFLNKTLGK